MVLFLHLLSGLPFVSQAVWRSTGTSQVFFAISNTESIYGIQKVLSMEEGHDMQTYSVGDRASDLGFL